LDGRVVAEKLTDNLGYAIFDVPAGNYTVMGIGGEAQKGRCFAGSDGRV
jgi:hypothetical protein